MSVKRMTHSETIVVPLERLSVLERARAEALKIAKGYTEVHGFGGWRTDSGMVTFENIAQITVWSDDWAAIEQWVLAVKDDLLSVGETDVFLSSTGTDDSVPGVGSMAGIFSS